MNTVVTIASEVTTYNQSTLLNYKLLLHSSIVTALLCYFKSKVPQIIYKSHLDFGILKLSQILIESETIVDLTLEIYRQTPKIGSFNIFAIQNYDMKQIRANGRIVQPAKP